MAVARAEQSMLQTASQTGSEARRRFAIGAEVREVGAHFRVWAPKTRGVSVLLDRAPGAVEHRLRAEREGYFSGLVHDARAGDLYWFRLEGVDRLLPDPASRYQPEGPHGPSQIVDPSRYAWQDAGFRGVSPRGQVVYELHVGTFTPEGTFAAACEKLPHLVELGVTVLQVMPAADFPGRFGWGYDGVNLFAPTRLYGTPDDLRSFVDTAHGLGLGVILDVVYNHFGPDGNYLELFSADYFTDRYANEWGRAINFDGDASRPVRELFVENARYWVSEYHFDGLRLDATQEMFDASSTHVLTEIQLAVREAAGARNTLVIAENEPQHARLARPTSRGGSGIDILYNDDFHHTARVALTGRNEAYYLNYRGTPQELVSAIKYGFLFQGQWYEWQKRVRGEAAFDLEGFAFLHFLQNHDQIANSPGGRRLHELTSAGCLRAMTALLLLGPETPLIFQGQEFMASSPFLYFADHRGELGGQVRNGRLEFVQQFASAQDSLLAERFDNPSSLDTFLRSKLDWTDVEAHAPTLKLHRDLIRLRRDDPAFREQRRDRVDGAVLDERSLVLRFFGENSDDRLLLVNLGHDAPLFAGTEPLLAPPTGKHWDTLWSSEHLDYGGCGVRPLETDGRWILSSQTALVLAARS
jgi:maltooligosyltrehalose trehalohydrolase